MDLSTTLKLCTVSGVSVGLWLVGLNRHIPPGWRGFSFALSSLSALTLLSEASRLNKIAPLEHGLKQLERELVLEELAYQHLDRQDALRRSYLPTPDPWGDSPPPAPTPRQPQPRRRQIPPDEDVVVDVEPITDSPRHEAIATLPPAGSGELVPFDFATITDPDGCPAVAIIGGSGSGKSVFTTWLISQYFPGSKIAVYDTDCQPHDWRGLRVVGRKGDTEAIADAMMDDLDLLQKRTQLRGEGKPVGGEEVRVCEEFATLAADLEPGDRRLQNPATEWLKRLVRRGRKYKFKLFLVSQSWSVASLKIQGEGDLRTGFTMIYLGSYAFEALKASEPNLQQREAIRAWLQAQPRPAIAIHQGQVYPCCIPDLATQPHPPHTPPAAPNHDFWDARNHKPLTQSPTSKFTWHPELAGVSQTDLERLEMLFSASPESNLSQMGERLLGWLKRQGKPQITLRELAQAKPLGRDVSHSKETVQPVLEELIRARLIRIDSDGNSILLDCWTGG